jgi:hypothetical protein
MLSDAACQAITRRQRPLPRAAGRHYRPEASTGALGGNYLLGRDGDRINALLAAAGPNLRLILRRLRLLFDDLLADLLGGLATQDTLDETSLHPN